VIAIDLAGAGPPAHGEGLQPPRRPRRSRPLCMAPPHWDDGERWVRVGAGGGCRMTRAHRKDGLIRVVQEKTGAELWIREHRDLAADLANGGEHMSLLTKADGSAFSGDTLSPWFADAIAEAGLPDDIVMHGLRKTAARMLAEAQCSVHEIMSITGHKSLKEVQRYTEAANQKLLASAAILKLERNVKRTSSGKRNRPKVANKI
jgi:integrase